MALHRPVISICLFVLGSFTLLRLTAKYQQLWNAKIQGPGYEVQDTKSGIITNSNQHYYNISPGKSFMYFQVFIYTLVRNSFQFSKLS